MVLVVRDASDVLSSTLSNVRAWNTVGWECIVVDDASLDRSLDIAQTFAAVDDRYVVLSHDRPVGRAAAIESGIAAATGASICVLDRTGLVDDADRQPGSPPDPDIVALPTVPFRRVTPDPEVHVGDDLVEGAIVLLAEAEYHVDELGPLADELRRRDRPVRFMLSPATSGAARRSIGRFASSVAAFDPTAVGRAAAVVTMNDWGECRGLIERANDSGVPTFAKVEGVQDFDDVDTGRERRPYRTASIVLGQGRNDAVALADRDVFIVGSTRLERIWTDPVAPRRDCVIANFNFTFQVLVAESERWLEGVRRAAKKCDLPLVVSAHPATRSAVYGAQVSDKPFRWEAGQGGILVSRFSTVPFEAMARGLGFVYHNPHGERVDAFDRPDGAFSISTNVDDLVCAIDEMSQVDPAERRRRSEGFFRGQVDVDPHNRSEHRAADIIMDVVSTTGA